MEYRILGPLEIKDGERVVALNRRMHRALLVLLLLRAGELVSRDVLIEELWAGRPPKAAREALQNNVSALRKELGHDAIDTRGSSYSLRIEPSQLDLLRFEQLVADARTTDSAEKRAAGLQAALALWRGPALGDLAYEPFAAGEIQRLEELRLAARQDLIDAQLALGRHREVVGELDPLVENHPFDERLRGQLMLARYRSGRQADALDAYQDARRALLDNLGLEPGVALRELEQAILRQDPSLDLPAVLPSVEERRKTVTVLSCEISPAASGLDPEEVRWLTVKALSTVRAAIDTNGGTVEAVGGDELLGVFGIPAAHEDDALRAVRAASELREELADVEARIGIDTGEVLAGHGFVSGEVVSRGKRLQRESAAGDILLGAATLALCRNAVKVRPAKGAFRLLGVEKGARPVARGLDAPLVGRKRELAALRRTYEEACEARRPRLVAVVGEPGIGKTRLVRELVAGFGDEATVLVGRCVSYGEGATFLPLREMLAQAGESLEEITGNADSVGEQLLAVRRFFERRAGERPLMLVFDDVHWAEPTLLDFVEQLGTHAEGPILTVCLARPELRERRPRLAEGAIELGPLGEKQVHALVDTLAADVPDEVRARVVETAGGNPLFAEQLVAYAQEGGALDAVPPSAEALIAARLDLLQPEERAVLQRAAVIGRLFSRGAVEDLSPPSDLAAIGDCILGLAEKSLVRRRRNGFRFHHVLVRDVAYGSLPKTERGVLHERLADWLDEYSEADELVGYHLEQAHRLRVELGRIDGRARRLAADAGGRLGAAGIAAWKRGDAPAAVNLLGRATGLLPDRDSFRLELCCELSLALLTVGELRRANETLATAAIAAADSGDRRLELRARLELAYLRLFTDEGRADELLDAAAQALPVFDAVEDHRSLGRAWLTLSFVHGLMHCRHAAATDAAERAMACYRRSGWPVSACLASLSAAAQNGAMPAHEAIRRCRQLLAQADLGGQANVLPSLAELEAMRGRLAEGRRLVARARMIYDQLGQQALAQINCSPIEGRIELLAGDADAAERALRASCETLERMGSLSYLATRAAELGDAVYGLGHYDEAERLSHRAEKLGGMDDVLTQILWRSLRARVLARQARPVEAEELIGEATRLAADTDALNLRAKVLLDRAEVLQLGGRSSEAGAAVEQSIQLFEQKGNVVAAKRSRRLLLELAPA
jgi:DNA-binding SARP family transcriptional activator